jgi:hypothetical protein
MGTTVLDAGVPIQEGLHVYAHNLRGKPGGVALLVINNSRTNATSLDLPLPAERYTLTAPKLEGKEVELNGRALKLEPNDEPPKLEGKRIPAGHVEFAPTSITFLAMPDAGNPSGTP